MKPLLSIKQAAAILGVSTCIVRRLVRSNRLKASNVSAGVFNASWRITEEDLQDFIDAGARDEPAPRVRQRKRKDDYVRFIGANATR